MSQHAKDKSAKDVEQCLSYFLIVFVAVNASEVVNSGLAVIRLQYLFVNNREIMTSENVYGIFLSFHAPSVYSKRAKGCNCYLPLL